MYINPELYKKEREMRGDGTDSWQKTNSDFDHQSRTARLFGKPELAPEMAEALKNFKDFEKDPNVKKVDLSTLNQPGTTESDINEDEVLG